MAQLKAHFVGHLVSEDLDGGEAWRLVEPLVYYSAILNDYIVVPKGFEADSYSSPPTMFGAYIVRGIDRRPAFIHDKLYGDGEVTREVADRILLEAMEAAEVPWWRRKLIYRAVRGFGGLFYKEPHEDEPTDRSPGA